jgi:hypothetical protein
VTTRKRNKSNKAEVGFANALLEAVANASGAGWFSDGQQKRLRSIICEEFSELMDAGLLYDNTQLDRFEHQSEITCFPNGNRPNNEPDGEAEAEEIAVDEVIIGPPISDSDTPVPGPDDEEESSECSSPTVHPNCRVIAIE